MLSELINKQNESTSLHSMGHWDYVRCMCSCEADCARTNFGMTDVQKYDRPDTKVEGQIGEFVDITDK